MNSRKLLIRLSSGSMSNVRFKDFVRLVEGFGFSPLRSSGSHHIYSRAGVSELVNVQNVKGEAKPYQIRQFLSLIERYELALDVKDAK